MFSMRFLPVRVGSLPAKDSTDQASLSKRPAQVFDDVEGYLVLLGASSDQHLVVTRPSVPPLAVPRVVFCKEEPLGLVDDPEQLFQGRVSHLRPPSVDADLS